MTREEQLQRIRERSADPPVFKPQLGPDPVVLRPTIDRHLSEIRLECLKLVWPAGSPGADPSHYIVKAETLLNWVLSGRG